MELDILWLHLQWIKSEKNEALNISKKAISSKVTWKEVTGITEVVFFFDSSTATILFANSAILRILLRI